MDSDDEDVIFENSVLHQALQNIGMEDIETEPRLQVTGTKLRTGDDASDVNCERPVSGMWSDSKSSFISNCIYNPAVLEKVQHYYKHETLQRLISSKLLSEEDRIFLHYFIEEDAPCNNPVKDLTTWSHSLICLLALSVVLLNILPVANLLLPWIALVLESTPIVSHLQLSPYIITLVFLHIAWLVLVILPIIRSKSKFHKQIMSEIKEQAAFVERVETEAWELMYLERKCLRLIRESELVARGFTVASQHHLATRQADSAGSWERWCPELRKIIVIENVTLMAELKKWVVKMMKNVPMICVDSDFNSLESLSLDQDICGNNKEENLNPRSVGQEDGSGNGLPKTSEVVVTSDLSKSVDLLSVYISGYIRRLALCFHLDNLRDKTIDSYGVTRECIEQTHAAMKKVWTALNRQYMFYRAVHKSDELIEVSEESSHASPAQGKSQIYNLYVCVNSLDLHLQSLLHTTRELTTTLEKRIDAERRSQAGINVRTEDSEQVGCMTTEDEEQWTDVFKRIKLSLESCKSCYEESLKHMNSKPTKEVVPSSQPSWKEADETSAKETKLKFIPAEDPVIVDQVFEAMSEAVDEDVPEVRPRYTAEDRARIQEQRETMKRLRQELHTVVGHRAIAQREREERALARAREELGDDHRQDITATQCPVAGSKLLAAAAGDEQRKKSDETLCHSVPEEPEHPEVGTVLPSQKLQNAPVDNGSTSSLSALIVGNSVPSEGEKPTVAAPAETVEGAGQNINNVNDCHLGNYEKTKQHTLLTEKDISTNCTDEDLVAVKMGCKEQLSQDSSSNLSYDETCRYSKEHAGMHKGFEFMDSSLQRDTESNQDRKKPHGEQSRLLEFDSQNSNIISSLTSVSNSETSKQDTAGLSVGQTDTTSHDIKLEDNHSHIKPLACGRLNSRDQSPLQSTPSTPSIKGACSSVLSDTVNSSGSENDIPQIPGNISLLDSKLYSQKTEGEEEDDPLIDNWVKISYQEMSSPGGGRLEMLREKDFDLEQILQQTGPAVPSPDPNSSFSKSLAAMVAARARNFNTSLLQEEEFGCDGSDSENEGDKSDSDR